MRVSMAGILLAGSALLSACGGGDDSPPSVSEEQVREEAATLVKPKPGLYRSDVVLEEFDAPGLPPQEANRLRERFVGLEGAETTICLTPEEAEEGFDKFVEQSEMGNCAVERFETSSEFINASMLCSGEAGVSSRIGVQGRGAEEQSRITLDIEQTVPQFSDAPIRFTLQITNERVGDCPSDAGE